MQSYKETMDALVELGQELSVLEKDLMQCRFDLEIERNKPNEPELQDALGADFNKRLFDSVGIDAAEKLFNHVSVKIDDSGNVLTTFGEYVDRSYDQWRAIPEALQLFSIPEIKQLALPHLRKKFLKAIEEAKAYKAAKDADDTGTTD